MILHACVLAIDGQFVKFSQEPDLTGEECQTLLQNYMSITEHVKETKDDNHCLQEKIAQYELWFKQFTEEKAKTQERLEHLEMENKVLVRRNEKVVSEAKESLQQENYTLRQEKDMLQRRLSLLQSENDQYRLSQQESVAFGLQPWKISRERVKLGKVIGGGGWGAVSEGDLKVAVKQFYPNIISSQNLVRLRREMEILARIRHPNLLQFIGVVFEEDDIADVVDNPPYIITELLDMSLREAYKKGKVSEKNLYFIFQDTARALDYLHRRHEPIVHRDVSSANVLLKGLPNGMWLAKVSDLGSANLAKDSFTKNEGAIIYCAPEAFTDESNTRSETLLTPKIDVYSYGIMLCEVINRTLPTQDKLQLLLEQAKEKQPEVHSRITIQCINQDPKERPSMADVLIALDKLSSHAIIISK
jgi:serine/threonine protein kinase